MTDSLRLAIVCYTAGVALICAVAAVRARTCGPLLTPALIFIEGLLLVQAALDVVALCTSRQPTELATHIGYLLASLVILPITVTSVGINNGIPDDKMTDDNAMAELHASTRWSSAAVAVGCLVVAVVSIRLHQTLGPVRHA